jgi:hypothetical protein
LLAHKSVSTDVIDNVRHIFVSQRNPDADIFKDLFLSCDPEFRKSWSRLDEKTRIAILHCKAGTGKKNHELQVRNHKLQVFQDQFYNASDTSDVTLHLGTPAIEESPTEPSTCTTLSASAASSTSNKSGKIIPSRRSNLPTTSSLHPGHPARMLSNKSKISIQDGSGNTLHFTANMAVQHTLHGPSCYHGLHDLLPSSLPSLTPCPMATYPISKRRVVHHTHHGLVDGGANSGIGSDRDMRILAYDALCPSLAALGRPQSDRTTPSFVYFRDDGEHLDSDGPTAPPWTQFKVTLKDKNGNPRLDSKGDPITVIAPWPSELQGWVFLTKPNKHGDIKCARVVELMNLHDATPEKNKDLVTFKIRYDRDDLEDIMSYNEILDYIEREHNSEDGPLWQFRRLLAHQHTPLGHPDQNGSDYNVKVEWETGEVTQEPLAILIEARIFKIKSRTKHISTKMSKS